jgi:membrane associated rhomboid family serine protease
MNNWFARVGKVTGTLIAINALVFLADTSSGGRVGNFLALYSNDWALAPWSLITYGFAHADIVHVALNMYSLWIFGEALERALGPQKFLTLYLGSVVAGGLAFGIFSAGSVVGASGGVFGLMAAYFIFMRAMGYRSSQMLVLIILNVSLGFFYSTVAVSAHIGGLVAGGAIAWYFVKARR